MKNCLSLLKFRLFADGTNIFPKSTKKDFDFIEIMNIELNKLSIWFKANKLSLNIDKTIIFKTKTRKLICNIISE